MNSDELYTLKSMVLDNYEQYHDGLRILLESDKGLYKAFGQSPRTKYLKTENFYLTSKKICACPPSHILSVSHFYFLKNATTTAPGPAWVPITLPTVV